MVLGLCIYGLLRHEERGVLVSAVTVAITVMGIGMGFHIVLLWAVHSYFAVTGITTKVYVKRLRERVQLSSTGATKDGESRCASGESKNSGR